MILAGNKVVSFQRNWLRVIKLIDIPIQRRKGICLFGGQRAGDAACAPRSWSAGPSWEATFTVVFD